MVSGLVTSPCDQLRIFSGEARLIRMESKSAIKFARSYGDERYIILLYKFGVAGWRPESQFGQSLIPNKPIPSFSPPRVRYPESPAASSSAPHPDIMTATRGSGR